MRKTQKNIIEELLQGRAAVAMQLQSPHEKPFMPSKIGRLLDRVSYRDWINLTGILLAFSVALLFFAPSDNGLKSSDGATPDLLSILYFCLITFTTVGYGDISPIGAARIVAVVLAIYGVTSLAFLIGKLASERSQATLLLLHTSDRERRLKSFSEDLQYARKEAYAAVLLKEKSELRRCTKQLIALLEAISNYVVFHVHQVKLGYIGNAPSLSRLIQDLIDTVEICPNILASETDDAAVVRRSWVLASRIEGLICFLLAASLQTDEDISSTFSRFLSRRPRRVEPLGPTQRALLVRLQLDLRKFRSIYLASPNAAILEDVLRQCESKRISELGRHFYKDIANSLSISINVTKRSVNILLAQGRLTI